MLRRSQRLFGLLSLAALNLSAPGVLGGEAELKLPPLDTVHFPALGGASGYTLMLLGIVVCALAAVFGIWQYNHTKTLPVHDSMRNVSSLIWETCKSYLFQQGKFLAILWVLIGVCIAYYFGFLTQHQDAAGTVTKGMPVGKVVVILLASILGILGSYGVAWFGMRINTQANSRSAFAALTGLPWGPLAIPMRSGMSVGMLLITVELFFMICILIFLPADLTGPCFIGFAIGESLGAAALRICGGIFTKIADIGSDLMKIVFKLPEDDPKNPGVIADCTGDNAGDSVGPTADGFETYGVTGVALITFLALTLGLTPLCATLITWIFVMRILMIITSFLAYVITNKVFTTKYSQAKDFHPELPLTWLVWLTSIISIVVTFVISNLMLKDLQVNGTAVPDLWWVLAVIISCGTAAGALIPEFTKIFTSTEARHVKEIVTASKQGGASLNILSGFVAGNFSAFWQGLLMLILMLIAYLMTLPAISPALSQTMPAAISFAAPIFAFGLVAFGFLGMGPVTIAVDSFGPVSDNAQSVYELSQIESIPGIDKDIEKNFGFKPDFKAAKHNLEKNDGAGNTFKATAKPVLIGTAVVGATTMLFAIILLLDKEFGGVITKLSLVQPTILLGFLMGGAVIYWFTGASCQAVVTGAYRAVVYIKENMDLSAKTASIEDSKEVVKICTIYAQKGMFNIFVAIFSLSLALAFFDSYFFIGYLISIAFFGLYQAIFMANGGGAWDNAKKIVEVDLRQKGTELHDATVVGDTVGDPFKDTSSVAMNPIIKFTTLFGLLATEIAVAMQKAQQTGLKTGIAVVLFVVALVFVYRSFYGMRIPEEK
ncbi:MAG: sodium-translocating pyrophosphatase [Verrucomicrobia bacterium]|jgi:K(+)-stimulated pyrophosphate-energized sodium pump|nr:sodium-translocating pyrophosphatase [Verrucomicrobiota bacterium]OQC65766.1 MAG: putative K(+)-stimulated pyrophosphate-energized sodium pump [Verrucomicrobia bacterium ADurb.Bin006]MDI9382344.1 sodium-translocating pyrophosphatase [Verrucomicrobiota bacterium]NMD18867.1 sodium-translocating pyrophosphatase [Verrucomicrobiota bacterium]HNU98796.1 sodium-translocating pyrophosphatase [Verrucomicrobiota bacterium]